MLNAAADQIRRHHEMLSQLDSAVGDGDHGTTILRAMEAVSKTVAESPASDLTDALLARLPGRSCPATAVPPGRCSAPFSWA